MKWIHMGPWPVKIAYTECPKAHAKQLRRMGITDTEFTATAHAGATTRWYSRGGWEPICIVSFRMDTEKKPSLCEAAGLIAHEIQHVLQFSQEHLNNGNSFGAEADAYFVQRLMIEMLAEHQRLRS